MGIFMIDQYGKRNGRLLSRRGVLRGAIAGVSTIAGSSAMKLWGAEQDEVYEGPLLVTLQLEGGVDVTQLCDPKVNVQESLKLITGQTLLIRVSRAISPLPPSR
jgi:hypothetical protein